MPVLKSVHITTGAKPKTEPTDRSNSPDVIRSVMASAISPSSTVKVSALPMLPSDRNVGLIAVKTISISTSSTKGPSSGLAISVRARPGAEPGAASGMAGASLDIGAFPEPS
jgi:hypothetical protein